MDPVLEELGEAEVLLELGDVVLELGVEVCELEVEF